LEPDRELEMLLKRKATKMTEQARSQENIPSGVIELTDTTLMSTIRDSAIPVFVDLWAPWCTPCKAVTPILEQLDEEYRGRMRFARLNTDENPQTANKFRVMSIPTFLVFKNGKLAARFVGAMPKAKFKAQIDKVLSKS